MFENKKVMVPRIGEEVHTSRLIASWLNAGGNLYEATLDDEGEPEYMFCVWLKALGISEDEVDYIWSVVTCGKLELEISTKRFRKTHEVLVE